MKIGFVLLSSPGDPVPSTRVAALNLFPALRASGDVPEILFHPDQATETPALSLSAERLQEQGFEIVVFQKVRGPSVLALASRLEALGVRTIYLVCDLIEPEIAAVASATIVVTEHLRMLYPPSLRHKVHVVHDGIERPGLFKAAAADGRGSRRRPLRAVIVTSKAAIEYRSIIGPLPRWLRIVVVGRFPPRAASLERLRQKYWLWKALPAGAPRRAFLRAALDRRIRCVPWTADGVYRELTGADIGLIPIDTGNGAPTSGFDPGWALKSENRLTLMMAAALPVVATPIASYLPVVKQGVNGFLASDPGEWRHALDKLRDPTLRRRMGHDARESVVNAFSVEAQARRFAEVVRAVMNAPGAR